MRTTLNLDDRLLDEARRITGTKERTALIHDGLRALIERESARRLARLGGSEPQLKPAPPLYIQEKLHPKVLLDDLRRQTVDSEK